MLPCLMLNDDEEADIWYTFTQMFPWCPFWQHKGNIVKASYKLQVLRAAASICKQTDEERVWLMLKKVRFPAFT